MPALDLRNPPAVRPLTADESDRLARLHGDALARSPKNNPANCITCEGEHKFRWWTERGTETGLYDCPCIDQWLLHRWLLNAGIDRSYQRLSWDDMTWANHDHLMVMQDYLTQSKPYVANGFGLFLHGPPATGKTALAVLGLKLLLSYGYTGYFTTFNDMIAVFTAGWRDPDEQRWFHQKVKNTTVLVLDDPGKEPGWGLSREMHISLIDEVLRHRVAGLRPTIITTNLTVKQFKEKYGEYVASLLMERATLHGFEGTDVRVDGLIRQRVREEIDHGLTRPVVIG